MSHQQQPVPDLQEASSAVSTEPQPALLPSATPERTPDPALDATIARIEQGSRDMQQYLDSIEQKIARIEPQLERLRQPVPDPSPLETSPTEPPAPPIAPPSNPGPNPGPNPRRRRSDLDPSAPVGDRRRSQRQVESLNSPDTLASLAPDWPAHLRSPRTWAAAAAVLVTLVLGSTWLLHIGRPHTAESTPASTESTADTATQPPLSSADPSPAVSAASNLPSAARPSAATPVAGSSVAPDPATTAGTPSLSEPATGSPGSPDPATAAAPFAAAAESDLPATTPGYTPVSPGRVRVSSGIMAANLIYSRQPEQPGGLARLFHLTGRVTMQVVVARNGRVANIRVLSGHRLLRGPAKDAVAAWRYRPFLVNGAPVDVATIVSVDFHR